MGWCLSFLQQVAFFGVPTMQLGEVILLVVEVKLYLDVLNLLFFFLHLFWTLLCLPHPYVHSLTIFYSVRYSPSHSLSLTDLTAVISGILFQWMTRNNFHVLSWEMDSEIHDSPLKHGTPTQNARFSNRRSKPSIRRSANLYAFCVGVPHFDIRVHSNEPSLRKAKRKSLKRAALLFLIIQTADESINM